MKRCGMPFLNTVIYLLHAIEMYLIVYMLNNILPLSESESIPSSEVELCYHKLVIHIKVYPFICTQPHNLGHNKK